MFRIFKRKKYQSEALIAIHDSLGIIREALRKAMAALWSLELKSHWISVEHAVPQHKEGGYSDIVTGYDKFYDDIVDCQLTYNSEFDYLNSKGWWERCDDMKGDCCITFWKPKTN